MKVKMGIEKILGKTKKKTLFFKLIHTLIEKGQLLYHNVSKFNQIYYMATDIDYVKEWIEHYRFQLIIEEQLQ